MKSPGLPLSVRGSPLFGECWALFPPPPPIFSWTLAFLTHEHNSSIHPVLNLNPQPLASSTSSCSDPWDPSFLLNPLPSYLAILPHLHTPFPELPTLLSAFLPCCSTVFCPLLSSPTCSLPQILLPFSPVFSVLQTFCPALPCPPSLYSGPSLSS